MKLTKVEEGMASGKYGSGIEMCMDILIKLGEAFGAQQIVRITSAHTMPKEPIDLLNKMVEGVARAGTFTTLHALMSAFDPQRWQEMGIPKEFALGELDLYEKRLDIHKRLAFYRTYTCLPMLVGNLPRKGDYVSWIGSGAQLIANSLIGARTNRDGAVTNLAAAITGRTPYMGLLLDENRRAEVIAVLEGFDHYQFTDTDMGAIGYYLGEKAQNRNVVIDGLSRGFGFDQLKYLMAPLSVSGSVSICHIVGITPEAPDLRYVLGCNKLPETIKIGRKEVNQTKLLYADSKKDEVDMALFGCPHCTITELERIASLLDGKRVGFNQRLWIGAPNQIYCLAQNMGYTDVIENAGGIISSACMATIPDAPIPSDVGVVATDSFKAAHYISRLTKGRVAVLIADKNLCIDAVTGGRWKGDNQ